jgi:UDP-2-acetamido-3-amino-2,3-dideoxy-glucuronate N-acetyltransferase
LELPNVPKVAVVGCGNWGKNLVRNFAHLGALAAVCDDDKVKLDQVTRDYRGVMVTQDFERILKEPTVQAVVIATPSDTHFRLAQQAMLAGKHAG